MIRTMSFCSASFAIGSSLFYVSPSNDTLSMARKPEAPVRDWRSLLKMVIQRQVLDNVVTKVTAIGASTIRYRFSAKLPACWSRLPRVWSSCFIAVASWHGQ